MVSLFPGSGSIRMQQQHLDFAVPPWPIPAQHLQFFHLACMRRNKDVPQIKPQNDMAGSMVS